MRLPDTAHSVARKYQNREIQLGSSISVGRTTLCTEQCELSFELGCARAYVPDDKRDLIAQEWNVPVVEGAMELQQSQLHLYEPLKVKVQSMEFEWPPREHHFTHSLVISLPFGGGHNQYLYIPTNTQMQCNLVFTGDSSDSLVYDILQLNVLHKGRRLRFQLVRYSGYHTFS
ncbi:hypothetical protein T265_04440 [Opisthorchis viverrini]|uniref:Uncharacterized protein n=1 Tax=Opisthorchis viverrini TaxID=6198 RepID=A0A074ZNS0_OPIVI|nr:hypothetical protein T265_04440 [Opisthorchis viverrini]KER28746.1 hypothetical protein T265_04440 [Opisthorchis viverrini]